MADRSNSLAARLTATEPAPPWSLAAAAVTLALAFASIFIGSILALLVVEVESTALLLGWTLSGVIMALTVSVLFRTPTRRQALRMDAPKSPIPFLMFIAFGFAVAVDLLGLVTTSASPPPVELFRFDSVSAPPLEWIIAVAFMVFAQPIGEELVFRGVLFPSLRMIFGGWGGLLVNALVYTAFHAAIYTANTIFNGSTALWVSIGVPLLHGLIFAAFRAYTGSTRAAIVAHAVFGLFAIVKLLAFTGS